MVIFYFCRVLKRDHPDVCRTTEPPFSSINVLFIVYFSISGFKALYNEKQAEIEALMEQQNQLQGDIAKIRQRKTEIATRLTDKDGIEMEIKRYNEKIENVKKTLKNPEDLRRELHAEKAVSCIYFFLWNRALPPVGLLCPWR